MNVTARLSSSPLPRAIILAAAIAAGALALALRVPGTTGALALTLLAGAIGGVAGAIVAGATGAPRPLTRPSLRWPVVVLVGCAAFACARAIGAVHPGPIWWPAAAAGVIAAVAEEAFFRRLVYGALAAFGPAAAIIGAALLFAAVHAPAYGAGILLIDFAAGIVLGWQRWASGGWSAPAVTHVVANLLSLGW